MLGRSLIVVSLLVIGFVFTACGGSSSSGSQEGGSGKSESQGSGSGKSFTSENYAELVSDPEGNRGASVDITGKVFQPPEVRGGEAVFQMWADPKNSEWNTIVRTDADSARVSSDDYVRVTGNVSGSFEGENAFGATVTAVELEADQIEPVDPIEAIDPTQKSVEVGQTREDNGFSITVDRVDFGREITRVYLSVRNATNNNATFFTHDARIVQGSRQVDTEQPFEYELPRIPSDISPGVVAEGVVAFGPVDPSTPFSITFNWSSRDYSTKTVPLVFEVSP